MAKGRTKAAERLRVFERLIKCVGEDLIQKAYHASTKLTDDEIEVIITGTFHGIKSNNEYYLARVMLLAVADEEYFKRQWGAQSMIDRKLVQKVRRILSSRP